MFIKYEAEVSCRVSGGERGVVDFGKLFTETNEQKFSLGGVQCKKICSNAVNSGQRILTEGSITGGSPKNCPFLGGIRPPPT